jgi:cytochrome c oxidase assembly factor CtaG
MSFTVIILFHWNHLVFHWYHFISLLLFYFTILNLREMENRLHVITRIPLKIDKAVNIMQVSRKLTKNVTSVSLSARYDTLPCPRSYSGKSARTPPC